MSTFQTALVISGSIFAVMMLSQLGRRAYTLHKVLLPVVSVLGFGYAYLRDVPTSGNSVWLYVAGIAVGAGFGVAATLATGLERDQTTGNLYTRTGAAFVITWLLAMGLRIAFVWGVDESAGFRRQVGMFMLDHHLVEGAIAPFFVLMALTTVIVRVAALKVRSNRVPVAAGQPKTLAATTV
jgi:hypothetical protein